MKNHADTRFKILLGLSISVSLWMLVDFYGPWKTNLRDFSPDESAHLETAAWRAYYDEHSTKLFFTMAKILRTQQGMPPVRAVVGAYWTAKAAFLFKEGRHRAEYARAIPYLDSYYAALCRTGGLQRDTRELAVRELDWWIIHRERGRHGESALVRAIADVTSELYDMPRDSMIPYARLRAQAMLERTEKDQERGMTEADWDEIEGLLKQSYSALFNALHQADH